MPPRSRLVGPAGGLRIHGAAERLTDLGTGLLVYRPVGQRMVEDGEGLLVTDPADLQAVTAAAGDDAPAAERQRIFADAIAAADRITSEDDPDDRFPDGDPWADRRAAAQADLDRWEARLEQAARKALSAWTAVAATAVLEDRYLTAAPTGGQLPPDPNAIPPLAGVWQRIAGTHIVSAIADLLGEVFGRFLREQHVVSARPWQEQYLTDVANRLAGVADSTFDLVRDVVRDGIDEGASIPDIRDRVQESLDAGGEVSWAHRARTIARTETIGAYNGGHLAAWQVLEEETGEAVDKVWIATIDPRTRDSHFRADGQRVALGEPFRVGGHSLAFPGDPTAPASEVVNCRCTMLELATDDPTPEVAERGFRDPADVQAEIDRRAEQDPPVVRAYDDPDASLQAAAAAGSLRPAEGVVARMDAIYRASYEDRTDPLLVDEAVVDPALVAAILEAGLTAAGGFGGLSSGEHYDPNQKRDAHGRWTRHGSVVAISVKGGPDEEASFAEPSEALLRVTFEHDDLRGSDGKTYRSRVTKVDLRAGISDVRIVIEDATGKLVGNSERTIRQVEDGPQAYHGSLQFRHAYQGLGLGSEFNRRAEEVYRAAGVTHIKLSASSSPGLGMVGAYVWARRGFGWASEYGPKNVAQGLRRLAGKKGKADPAVEDAIQRLTSGDLAAMPTPFEISELRIAGDAPDAGIGKRALLGDVTAGGVTWEGVRWLPALEDERAADDPAPSQVAPLTGADAFKLVSDALQRPLTDDEQEALGDYQLTSFLPINRHLRGVDPAEGNRLTRIERQTALLTAVTADTKLPAPIQAWRGVRDTSSFLPPEGSAVGTVVTDGGFMSISTDREVSDLFGYGDEVTMLRVTVPAGHPILPVDQAQAGPGVKMPEGEYRQEEVILPPGSSFRITGERREKGNRVLDVEVLPYQGPEAAAAAAAGKPVSEAAASTPPPSVLTGDDALAAASDLVPGRLEGIEHKAVRAYTGTGYGEMNRYLRGTGTISPDFLEETTAHIEALRAVADRHRLTEPIVVLRGQQRANTILPGGAVGAIITDPGFMSTSTDPGVAKSFAGLRLDDSAILELTVPVGHPVLPVDALAKGPLEYGDSHIGEWEVALPPGSAFRVTGERRNEQGRRIVTAEVLEYQGEEARAAAAAGTVAGLSTKLDVAQLDALDWFVAPDWYGSEPMPDEAIVAGLKARGLLEPIPGSTSTWKLMLTPLGHEALDTGRAPEATAPAPVLNEDEGEMEAEPVAGGMADADLADLASAGGPMSGAERDALEVYGGYGHRLMNAYLRGAVTDLPDLERAAIDGLRAVADRHRLTWPVEVWRGLSGAEVLPPRGQAVGRVLADPGFMSTSTDRAIAEKFLAGGDTGEEDVLLRVTVPEGHPAIPVDALMGLDPDDPDVGEREVLLPPGASFRITRDEDVDGVRVLSVEVLAYNPEAVTPASPTLADVAAADPAVPDAPARTYRALPTPQDGDAFLREHFDPKALTKPEKEALGYWTSGNYRQVNELLRTGSLELKVMTQRGTFEPDPDSPLGRGLRPVTKPVYKTATVHSTDEIRALAAEADGGSPTLERLASQIDTLPAAIGKHELPEDMSLFRVAALPELARADPDSLIGSTITDRGYVATSTSEKSAVLVTSEALGVAGADAVLFEIRTPAGTPFATPELPFGTVNGTKLGGYTRVQEVLLEPSSFRVVEVVDDAVDTSGYSLKNGALVKPDGKAKRPPTKIRRIVVERLDADAVPAPAAAPAGDAPEAPDVPDAPELDAPEADAPKAPALADLSARELSREGPGRLTGSVNPEVRSDGHRLHSRFMAAEANNLGTAESQRLMDDQLQIALDETRELIGGALGRRGDWDEDRVNAALDEIQRRLDARRAAAAAEPAPAVPEPVAAAPDAPPLRLTAARVTALEYYAVPVAERSGKAPNYSVYMPLLRSGLIERDEAGKYVATDAGRAALTDVPADTAPSALATDLPADVPPLEGEEAHAALPRLAADAPTDLHTALADYQGAGYATVNQYLRGGRVVMPSLAEELRDKLDAALAGTVLEQPITVHRGTGNASLVLGSDPLEPGSVIIDPGYLSTSTDPTVPTKFLLFQYDPAVLTIDVPAGAHVVSVNGDEAHDEREALLPRSTRLRVTSDTTERHVINQDAYDTLAKKAKRGGLTDEELEQTARARQIVVDLRRVRAEVVVADDPRDASPDTPAEAAPAASRPSAAPDSPADSADATDAAAATLAAERAAAEAKAEKRRAAAARKAEKRRAEEEAARAAALEAATDDAGFPQKLTYEYLADLDEERREDLEVHLIEGVVAGDPLAEQRLEDLTLFNEAQAVSDELASQEGSLGTAGVSREIADWLESNGRPGLTHPLVGGDGASGDVLGVPSFKQVRLEYWAWLEEQHIKAEDATRGSLVNRRGQKLGKTGEDMFSSKRGVADVMQYASDELLEWFESNRRITWAEFYYERTRSPAFAERAAKDRAISEAINRDRTALDDANSESRRKSKQRGGSSRRSAVDRAREAALTAAARRAPAAPVAPTQAQLDAYAAGRAAHAAGQPATACPFDPAKDARDPEGLFVLWLRGYRAGKSAAFTARRVAEGLLPDPAAERLGWSEGDVLVLPATAHDADPADRLLGIEGELVMGVAVALTASPASSGHTVTAAGSGPGDVSDLEGRPPMPRTWRSAPHLAPFGIPTGDGRIFKVGSLSARELPLPLLFQPSSGFGHDGSVVVGRILEVNFTDVGIEASGDYLDADPDKAPDLAKAIEQAVALTESGLGHVSVDLSDVVGELVDEDGNEISMEDLFDAWERGEDPKVLEQVSEGKLIACTQVATPAFEGAKIELAAAPVAVDGEAALEDASGAAIAVGAVVDVETDEGVIRGEVTAVDEDAETVTVQPTDDEGAATGDPLEVAPAAITVVTPAGDPADDEEEDAEVSLIAAAGPLRPPAAWFEDPKLAGPTALTITDDGRVFGHVAVWGQCHVGFSSTCVTPPTSPSGYKHFHVGEVVTEDGSRVAVGNLTLGGRHADVRLAYRSAIEHYDVSGAGVAVVRCYEDEHGIAFAGAVAPGVSEEQLYDMRRSPVSGDWRRVGGELEMIGVLAVNSGGFNTPRFATDEAGRTALVAAPSVRPHSEEALVAAAGGRRAGVLSQSELIARITKDATAAVRRQLAEEQAAAERTRRLRGLATAIKADPRSRLQRLAAAVEAPQRQARASRLAELAQVVGA